MQIALTKNLAEALELKRMADNEPINPLFAWTANWTKVWSNRRAEDMIVLVNNAHRFTVAIYQVKKKDLKNLKEMIKAAIADTLLFMNVNPAIVKEYLRLAGDLEFTRNRSRQTASWVTKAGVDCSFYIGREYNGIDKIYSDTVGAVVNYDRVNFSQSKAEVFVPYEAMLKALSELTGLPAYRYRAFELLVTLDLEIDKVVRRMIVPANLQFAQLHKLLQSLFNWKNYHLYDFSIIDSKRHQPVVRLVPDAESLAYAEHAVLMGQHTLAEFLPAYSRMIYTYDLGDNWEHEIRLVNVLEDYDQESPYLLEASGKTPPENVGGVSGYQRFLKILQDPVHPDHEYVKEWAGYWSPELREWEKRPKVMRVHW